MGADTKGSGKIDFKDFVYFIQEKLGSADMFDKRLSSRYRNSFPRRTNSFLRKLNLHPKDAGASNSNDSSGLSGPIWQRRSMQKEWMSRVLMPRTSTSRLEGSLPSIKKSSRHSNLCCFFKGWALEQNNLELSIAV